VESHALHELGVLGVPDGLALRVAVRHDALHVVGEHVVGHAEVEERVDHAYEEALLARVGEELDEEAAAVVAYQREAGDLEGEAQAVDDVHEAPVHLEGLARLRLEAPAAVALRLDRELALGGHQVPVLLDVDLHGRAAALVALRDDPVVADLRVRDAGAQQVVQHFLVAGELGGLGPPAGPAVRQDLEGVVLQPPAPRPRKAHPAPELGEVHLVEVERSAVLERHLEQRLVYNLL